MLKKLCSKNCCPVYNTKTGMIEENGIELLPEYVLEEWESREAGENEIIIAGIRFDEEIIKNIKKQLNVV